MNLDDRKDDSPKKAMWATWLTAHIEGLRSVLVSFKRLVREFNDPETRAAFRSLRSLVDSLKTKIIGSAVASSGPPWLRKFVAATLMVFFYFVALDSLVWAFAFFLVATSLFGQDPGKLALAWGMCFAFAGGFGLYLHFAEANRQSVWRPRAIAG